MTLSLRRLIPELLQTPEVDELLSAVLETCTSHIEKEQGLCRKSAPVASELLNTGVGTLRRVTRELKEPVSTSTLALTITLLMKTDGTVVLWHELWAPNATTFRLPDGQSALPAQVRLGRLTHLSAVARCRGLVRSQDPQSTGLERLAEIGLFSLRALKEEVLRELVYPLAP